MTDMGSTKSLSTFPAWSKFERKAHRKEAGGISFELGCEKYSLHPLASQGPVVDDALSSQSGLLVVFVSGRPGTRASWGHMLTRASPTCKFGIPYEAKTKIRNSV